MAIADMVHLRSALMDVSGEAAMRFVCGTDRDGHQRIGGHVEATLTLRCQRCLEGCYHPVDTRFEIVVVESEAEGEALPEEFEPFVADGHAVQPLRVAEEELILALPPVALHPAGQCRPPGNPAHLAPEEKSPFAQLKGRVGPARGHETDGNDP